METKRQKSSFNRANARRDHNPGQKSPQKRPPPLFPEKLSPSRRLNRDGE
jgi:hypothetical protein